MSRQPINLGGRRVYAVIEPLSDTDLAMLAPATHRMAAAWFDLSAGSTFEADGSQYEVLAVRDPWDEFDADTLRARMLAALPEFSDPRERAAARERVGAEVQARIAEAATQRRRTMDVLLKVTA